MNKLYLGNLPYNATDEDISQYFAECGVIEDVVHIKDRFTGRSKGFGFITFAEEKAAEQALQMDGNDFHGRPIKINKAQERTDKRGRH